MTKYLRGGERDDQLADVAELYYGEGLTQAQISRHIKVTRSAISRMLSEARQKGIVEIQVRRPIHFDAELEKKLARRFDLQNAHVLAWEQGKGVEELRTRLGQAGSQALIGLLRPDITLGVAWGTTVNATIDALEVPARYPIKVVQLVGVLGSSSHVFNAQALVQKLAQKLGGEGIYLYTPYIVENEEVVRSLLHIPTVHQAIAMGKQCQVALLGIGTTVPELCTLYQGGHISRQELDILIRSGAVGDVSGRHFDIHGQTPVADFLSRLVAISKEDLVKIPTRLGVAGGSPKAPAILGALRGKYVNALVTDSVTAELVLELDSNT